MSRDEPKTIVVSQITKVSVGMDDNGYPHVTIESAAPYKDVINDAVDVFLTLSSNESDEDESDEEEVIEDEENE